MAIVILITEDHRALQASARRLNEENQLVNTATLLKARARKARAIDPNLSEPNDVNLALFTKCAQRFGDIRNVIARSLALSLWTASCAAGAILALPASSSAQESTPIRISIDGQVMHAVLWDNPAARSLLDQLPLTLEFTNYGSQEVIAVPPGAITMDGMPEGDSPISGDIGFYRPTGVVSFFYSDIGFWKGSARLGRIDGDLNILRGRSDPFSVTIERSD